MVGMGVLITGGGSSLNTKPSELSKKVPTEFHLFSLETAFLRTSRIGEHIFANTYIYNMGLKRPGTGGVRITRIKRFSEKDSSLFQGKRYIMRASGQ